MERPLAVSALLFLPCLLHAGTHLTANNATASEATSLTKLNKQFSHYDPNGDGKAEIEWVRSAGLGRKAQGRCRGTVMVVIEPRLLVDRRGQASERLLSLRPALSMYAKDLAAEGWRVFGVAMQVYAGPTHQDGRTLLAMRDYLRQVKRIVPDLSGVVIVGSFPEAMLVRQYNWRQHTETVLNKGKPNEEKFEGKKVHRLRSVAELVAWRCELVVSDLDGNWEQLYHEGPEDLPSILAIYPEARLPEGAGPEDEWLKGGPTKYYEKGSDRYSDFFFVNDGRFAAETMENGGINLRLLDDERDDECSAADKQRGNPMARPDLLVSRIDTRHIALKPKASLRGAKGEGLLNDKGLPQAVTFPSEKETPGGVGVWEWDPVLERKLLIEFFDRNHRYRHGEFAQHLKPAAAAYGLGSAMPELVAARPEWKDFKEPGYDVHDDEATLLAAVQWLKRPAALRFIGAHSDPWGSHFKKTEDVAALEKECGGQPWSWVKQGTQLVPTLGATGKLDLAVTRTLWQNGVLPDTASFYLHSGCEGTAPACAERVPYNHPEYGYWQGAEGLLFYCKGLALVGRSKVFYDFPTDFAKQLGEGKTFGEAWAHYFDTESAESDVRKVGGGIGRKRAYFWGVLGDWTLRLSRVGAGL